MRPAAFDYLRPKTLREALDGITRGGVILAGGQSLIQAMRLRQAEPSLIVDISELADLSDAVVFGDDTVRIGARVTQADLIGDSRIAAEFPWLTDAAERIGDVQVRNRGTVAGNVCWADPRANMAVALLASDASICLAGRDGTRQMTLGNFFRGFRRNALDRQIATAIVVPRAPGGRRGAYREFSRQPQDLALCNVCVVLGREHSRVVVGGIHVTPVRLTGLESALQAPRLGGPALVEAIETAIGDCVLEPFDEVFGTPEYQKHLANVMLGRVLTELGAAGV